MSVTFTELDNFNSRIFTIEDCEKKIKILIELFDNEKDELERLELNKYILRLQSRLTSLRANSINNIFNS